jgi:putative Mg2+ transporter-C (MgtC) family protein
MELNIVTILLRLFLATVCAGVLGVERQRKSRPAGLRTHIIVCLGSALVMMISQHLSDVGMTTDAARLGAQVISGIGFLGAGTIILTGRNGKPQVKGLTTAASLWTCACMGLAIGCGFYLGALATCLFVLFAVTVLNRVDKYFYSKIRALFLQVEIKEPSDLASVCTRLEEGGVEIRDLQIQKRIENTETHTYATLDLRLHSAKEKTEMIVGLSSLPGVVAIEEL